MTSGVVGWSSTWRVRCGSLKPFGYASTFHLPALFSQKIPLRLLWRARRGRTACLPSGAAQHSRHPPKKKETTKPKKKKAWAITANGARLHQQRVGNDRAPTIGFQKTGEESAPSSRRVCEKLRTTEETGGKMVRDIKAALFAFVPQPLCSLEKNERI